jgi:hypothetical protein
MSLARDLADGVINGLTPQASNMQPFNRIINGAMTIDQRNAGAAVTNISGNLYCVDRFILQGSQASKLTAQQNAASITPPDGLLNYLGITSTSSYSVLAGDYFGILHNVEGFNIVGLSWGTANAKAVTVSFWVRSSLTGTFGGSVRGAGYQRAYPFSYVINSSNTWEHKTVAISGCTDGTWLITNGVGLQLLLGLGYGTDYGSGTAGAWTSAGNSNVPAGSTSVVGTSGATFYITGVQLEAGSTASPFAHENYGDTLQKCQRYYYKMGAVAPIANCYYASPAYCAGNIDWPVTMRASPTVVIDSGHISLIGDGTFSSISSTVNRLQYLTFSLTAAVGYSARGLISASAEL